MIFNSLGSNYDFGYVVKSLFGFSDGVKSLKNVLKNKFSGEVVLFYKGREAIEAALRISGLKKGEYVAINGLTCYVVYKAVTNAGLKVEYLDIDKESLNFSSEILERAIKRNSKIRAVIVQNTLGYPCDIENISAICKKNGLILIEDLAHSVDAIYQNGQPAGSYGDFVALSFSQDKIIDAVSGGALIVRNAKFKNYPSPILETIPLIWYLKDRLYPKLTFIIRSSYGLGFGKAMHYFLKKIHLLSTPLEKKIDALHFLPNWHSSLAINYISNLDGDIRHRRKIAIIYQKNINSSVLSNKLAMDIRDSTNIRFPIFVDKRDNLIKFLKNYGIYISDTWYDAPIAPRRCQELTDYKHQCQNSEKAASTIINLPTHKNVSEKDALFISAKINQWLDTK